MATISLCMIVKDEERFLEQCLDSVREYVDEIIIVDTGSKDRTAEIARQFTDRIFSLEWTDDFSAARNFSIKHAKCDWILVLDADETVSEKDMKKIKQAAENAENDVWGFGLVQRNYTDNRTLSGFRERDRYRECRDFQGYVPSLIVRLFRNNRKIRFEYPVHEAVDRSILGSGRRIVRTDIQFHHYGIAGQKKKEEKEKRNIAINERLAAAQTDDPKPYYELGLSYRARRDFPQAIKMFERVIGLDSRFKHPYFNLGEIYLSLKRYSDAIECLLTEIKLNNDNVEAFSNLAVAYFESGQPEKARGVLAAALRTSPKNQGLLHNLQVMCRKQIALSSQKIKKDPENPKNFFELGQSYEILGDLGGARKAYEQCIALDPDFPSAYSRLILAYKKLGMHANAVSAYKNAIRSNPDDKQAHLNLALMSLEKKQFRTAIKLYQRVLGIDRDDVLAHLGIGIAYFESGNPVEARKFFQKALRLDPRNKGARHYLSLL